MRISDWSSDVCSSDLDEHAGPARWLSHFHRSPDGLARFEPITLKNRDFRQQQFECHGRANCAAMFDEFQPALGNFAGTHQAMTLHFQSEPCRSEEHTSELQSLMRISYAVFCFKKTHYS